MNFTDETMQMLARQLGANYRASRDELEEIVAPLVRVVLRTGRGRPSVVRFVRQHLRVLVPESCGEAEVDAEWATPRLARLLIAHMLQQVRRERNRTSVRETVLV